MNIRQDLFDALGFHYCVVDEHDAAPPPASPAEMVDRVQARFAEMVYATAHFEDIGFTGEEIERLLGGITVGGRKLEQEQQVLNEARAWHHLIGLVRRREFDLNERTYCELHRLLARDPGLTWGVFDDRSVPVGGTYQRAPRKYIADERFEPGMGVIRQIDDPRERAATAFLFASLNTFLVNFNERVARLLMQGTLMQNGYMPILIPPRMRMEFDIRMMRFYDSLDGTEMIQFLISQCNPPLTEPSKRRLHGRQRTGLRGQQ